MENCPTDFEELWKKYITLVRILWNHASWRGKEILNASVLLKIILGLGKGKVLRDSNEVTHDYPVNYLSSVPEKKFKYIANEINTCYILINLNKN